MLYARLQASPQNPTVRVPFSLSPVLALNYSSLFTIHSSRPFLLPFCIFWHMIIFDYDKGEWIDLAEQRGCTKQDMTVLDFVIVPKMSSRTS